MSDSHLLSVVPRASLRTLGVPAKLAASHSCAAGGKRPDSPGHARTHTHAHHPPALTPPWESLCPLTCHNEQSQCNGHPAEDNALVCLANKYGCRFTQAIWAGVHAV